MGRILKALLLSLFPLSASALDLLPGVKGFGSDAVAGRGGTVYIVDSLAATGTGTLHACMSASGPRVCIFETSGTIEYDDTFKIRNPFITIAGQTAPDPGIQFRGTIWIETQNVLLQHFTIAPATFVSGEPDALGILVQNGEPDTEYVVIDHMSIRMSVDGLLDTYNAQGSGDPDGVNNILYHRNILSYPLDDSVHSKGPHGYGVLLNAWTREASIISNLFAHVDQRLPFMQGWAEVKNNLMYNWRPFATTVKGTSGDVGKANVIGNWYEFGPESNSIYSIDLRDTGSGGPSQTYLSDNINDVRTVDTNAIILSSPIPELTSNYVAIPGSQVFDDVLDDVGPHAAFRDPLDAQAIQDVRDGTGAIIDSVNDVGGYPTRAVNTRSLTLPTNPNADDDGDGYTNLEEWLHNWSANVENPSGGGTGWTPETGCLF